MPDIAMIAPATIAPAAPQMSTPQAGNDVASAGTDNSASDFATCLNASIGPAAQPKSVASQAPKNSAANLPASNGATNTRATGSNQKNGSSQQNTGSVASPITTSVMQNSVAAGSQTQVPANIGEATPSILVLPLLTQDATGEPDAAVEQSSADELNSGLTLEAAPAISSSAQAGRLAATNSDTAKLGTAAKTATPRETSEASQIVSSISAAAAQIKEAAQAANSSSTSTAFYPPANASSTGISSAPAVNNPGASSSASDATAATSVHFSRVQQSPQELGFAFQQMSAEVVAFGSGATNTTSASSPENSGTWSAGMTLRAKTSGTAVAATQADPVADAPANPPSQAQAAQPVNAARVNPATSSGAETGSQNSGANSSGGRSRIDLGFAEAPKSSTGADSPSLSAAIPQAGQQSAAQAQPLQTAQPQASETATSLNASVRNALASESAPAHPVPSPTTLQAADAAEMRVSVQTQTLGQVELRARLQGDQLGAEISVQHREAHAALSSELPSLHAALNEQQVRVGQVTVVQDTAGTSASTQDSQNRQQQQNLAASSQKQTGAQDHSQFSEAASSIANVSPSSVFDSNGRLSVRA